MRPTLLLALAALLGPALPAAAGTPPPGFTETVVTDDVSQPTAIAFLPDGRLLVTQKTGALRQVSGGVTTTLVTIPVCTGSEMGLLGVAVDPDFTNNGFIYLYRTNPAPGGCGSSSGRFNQVVRVTMAPDGTVAIGSLVVLLTGIRTDNGNHDGGGLRIGPDQKLYVAVGDTGLGDNQGGPGSSTNPYAQDLDALEGKVLRLNLDGTAPADNPFVGVVGARPEVFAYGFRNPFRFGFDPSTGSLWLGDVGDLTFEEIDVVVAGGNYSWPYCEGVQPGGCAEPGDVAPILTYPHSGGASLGSTVIGGAFAPAGYGAFGTHYFFADYIDGTIYRASLNGARDDFASAPATFVSSAQGPVDVIFGPDGALYYVAIFAGEVLRVAPDVVGPSAELLTGRKLLLRDHADPARRNASLRSNQAVTLGGGNGSDDDPTLHGGSLRIVGGGFDDTYALPAAAWQTIGPPGQNRGYVYRDRPRANGPFTQVRVNAGRFLTATGRGAGLGHDLATNPDPVSVVLTIGDHQYCATYGGAVTFVAGKRFHAKDAPVAGSCPP
jgi:glucose/arabinose dehydrogenase